MGEITQERIDILQKADKIFIDELKAQKLYDSLSQAFVVYLPIKSVVLLVMKEGMKMS